LRLSFVLIKRVRTAVGLQCKGLKVRGQGKKLYLLGVDEESANRGEWNEEQWSNDQSNADISSSTRQQVTCSKVKHNIHCVSKKTSPTFLAITRESIDGFL